MIRSVLVLLLATSAAGFSTRRALLRNACAAASVVVAAPAASYAIDACPPKSKNCLSTTWTAPAGTKNVAGDVLEILKSYPQEGQNKVDLGGYSIVSSDAKGARIEYQSGIGNFAKFLNGGKPFVDDLTVEVSGDSVAFKSASRIGESDLGVNQKRMQFLAQQARAKGWTAPDPVY